MTNSLFLRSFYLPLISFLAAFIMLVSLGIWQTYRLKEKENYIKQVFENLKKHPAELSTSKMENLTVYQKVRVNGKLIVEKAIWVYRRHPGAKYQDGAYLFIPLLIENDKYLLVTIGWISTDNKERTLDKLRHTPDIQITGILLNSEENSMFLPRNDYEKKIFFTIDLQEIKNYLNINIPLLYLAGLEDNKGNELFIKKITPEMLIKIKNDHLEYAVTWFTLAGILFIFYILHLKKMQYFGK